MNLCFICREYPPAPRVGGIGWATRDQARELAQLGHRVHVVAPALDDPATVADGDVLVHRVPVPRIRVAPTGLGQTLDRLAWSRAAARAVARLHRDERLDVVEAPEFAAEGFVVTRRPAPPVVVRLHTPLTLVRQLNGTPLTADCRHTVRLERAALERASAVTAPSRAIADACAEAGYGHRAAAATVIPSGLDTTLFCPDGRKEHRSSAPLVLFVGRLETRKGIGDLADALPVIAASVPGAHFALVGADTATAPGGLSWREHLQAQVRAAGTEDRIRLVGPVPREDLPSWYRAATVVVAPSPFENLAMVFIEALACGRPVVGCSSGAFPEIVTDGREGRIVPPHDPGALAGAVVGLLDDPALVVTMGEHARRRAMEAFSLERTAARSAELYAEVATLRTVA